jgi:hypothetical protein
MPDDCGQFTFAACHGNSATYGKDLIDNQSSAIQGQILCIPKLPQGGSVLVARKHDQFGITDARLQASIGH